jgi:hypothetical protein
MLSGTCMYPSGPSCGNADESHNCTQVGEEMEDADGVLLRRVDDSPSNPLEWIIYAMYRTTTSVRRIVSSLIGARPQVG